MSSHKSKRKHKKSKSKRQKHHPKEKKREKQESEVRKTQQRVGRRDPRGASQDSGRARECSPRDPPPRLSPRRNVSARGPRDTSPEVSDEPNKECDPRDASGSQSPSIDKAVRKALRKYKRSARRKKARSKRKHRKYDSSSSSSSSSESSSSSDESSSDSSSDSSSSSSSESSNSKDRARPKKRKANPEDEGPKTKCQKTDAEAKDETDQEINELLGEDKEISTQGPEFHEKFSESWKKASRSGLGKDERKEIIAKYPPSSNCPSSYPPVLNPPIKAILKPADIRKDMFQSVNQKQLGAVINGVGIVLTELLKHKDILPQEVKSLIHTLNESGKLASDLQYLLSITRRIIVGRKLNPLVKTVSEAIPVDSQLFGENFADQLKNAQATEKSMRVMTGRSTSRSYTSTQENKNKNYSTQNQAQYRQNPVNFEGLPKKNYKPSSSGGQQQRTYQNYRSQAKKPSRR